MSDTYSYEVLEPGGHARLVGNVLDRISRASTNPASAVGSAAALLGDTETASWTERTTSADGAALIDAVYGNTLRWNQKVPSDTYWNDHANTSHAIADGVITVEATSTTGFGVYRTESVIGGGTGLVVGHTYCGIADVNPSIDASMYMGLNISSSGTDAFVFGTSATAGKWTRIAGITKLTAASNNGLRIAVGGSATVTAGDTFQVKNPQLFDLTAMFGEGNEPATVAEFEALFPDAYYPYDPGSLLPVRMEGVETVGFNQWDEQWELGYYNTSTGEKATATTRIRSKNPIPVFPDTDYYLNFGSYSLGSQGLDLCFYDASGQFVSFLRKWSASLTTPANAHYMTWSTQPAYGATYNNDICINISDPARNGTYEPYWSSQLAIPASTYFPDGMRSAGTVRDELTETAAITRVGEMDLGTLTWYKADDLGGAPVYYASLADIAAAANNDASSVSCAALTGVAASYLYVNPSEMNLISLNANKLLWARHAAADAAAFKAAMSDVMLYYPLATPTTTPIDPPLPMSYRTGKGGTERVMVASDTQSAPPIFATRYPLDPTDLAASIAPRESATAESNHAVGDLVMLGWTLCKVTTAIARGESITIGTNVTRTSVAAELAALS